MTQTQVEELQNSIIFGVLLVVGVLLFFLGLRNALFVGVAIPLSMFMSFLILNSLGVTFNTMVLFSLVLALGMLVDNGIVVVENVYRLMDEGYSPLNAARYGVGEVAWPIIASTGTTLAAFLPLALWPGLIGEFMSYLPMTLIIVLGSFLFVALVINPVLTAVFMKVGEEHVSRRRTHLVSGLVAVGAAFLALGATGLGNMLALAGVLTLLNTYVLYPATLMFQNRFLPRGVRLRAVLDVRVGRTPAFGPSSSGPWAVVLVDGADGRVPAQSAVLPRQPTTVPQHLRVQTHWHRPQRHQRGGEGHRAAGHGGAGAGRVQAPQPGDGRAGELPRELRHRHRGQNQRPQRRSAARPHAAQGAHCGQLREVPRPPRLATGDVLSAIRDELKGYPDAEVVVTKNSDGPPQGAPINLELTGDDYDELLAASEEVLLYLRGKDYAGVEELKIDVDKRKPQMPVTIDREYARTYGLSTRDIGYTLRTALFGREVGTFKDGEDDYPINLRFSEKHRHSSDALMNQRSSSEPIGRPNQGSAHQRGGHCEPRHDVQRGQAEGPQARHHHHVQRVGGRQPHRDLSNMEVDMAEELNLPTTVKWAFTGQQEEQAKEMAFLSKALLIALFLIFLIIVSQFNSVTTPFIIGFSVVFSLIGVLLGLVIFQMEFVIIMTMIGIISLAGVVVNNAIVLIDYTNLLRARRREELGLEEGEAQRQ